MNREITSPPHDNLSFKEMKKKQAEEYFEWYVSQIPLKIELLEEIAASDGVKTVFDFTPESLIPIWEWHETKITYRQLTEEEIQAERNMHPEWMWDRIADRDLSFDTLYYCMALALYFAEVIIRNANGKVNWGFFSKPKNRMGVNEPTLLGFKCNQDLNPRRVLVNCTRKSAREFKSTRLKDAYDIWIKDVE